MQGDRIQFPISMDVMNLVVPFMDTKSYYNSCLSCQFLQSVLKGSCQYTYDTWMALGSSPSLADIHTMLESRRLFELYVLVENDPKPFYSVRDSSHSSLLDHAVSLHMYNMASYLVSRGFQPCVESETMFECIRAHDIKGASILLSSSLVIDRFRSRDNGYDVLTCAVEYGSSELVDLFLSKGVSIPDGILCLALSLRDPEPQTLAKVSLLLDKGGCDPNTLSMNGHPALHVAIEDNSHLSLLESLISRGADINLKSRSAGGGYTALDIADMKRRRTFYEYLERLGARHSLRYAVERESVPIICESLQRKLPKESDRIHLISFAAAAGLTSSLRTLVRLGRVDIHDVLVRDDITPLHLAACRGHYSACKFLIESGINVSAKAFGGADIHAFAASIAGSPTWSQNFNLPDGALVPPPVRWKTAAELAREAGHDRLGKLIDLSVVEAVIARRDSMDSTVSWPSTSGGNSPITSGVVPASEIQSPAIVLEGLPEHSQ